MTDRIATPSVSLNLRHISARLAGGVLAPIGAFLVTLVAAQAYHGVLPAYLPIAALALVMWGTNDYRRPARARRRAR